MSPTPYCAVGEFYLIRV